MSNIAIIPCAGSGTRFGSRIPKQYLKINNKEILAHTISVFERVRLIDYIILSVDRKYLKKVISIISKYKFKKVYAVVSGGKTRQESVYNAISILECAMDDIIIVHDAVRPFLKESLLRKIIQTALESGASVPGLKLSDSIKLTDKKGFIQKSIDRNKLIAVQTPQAAKFKMFVKAYQKAIRNKFTGTDEASVLEYAGYKVKITEGDTSNTKITKKQDLKNL